MDANMKRAFICHRRPCRKHMMRFVRRFPYVTYRCEACFYTFHPEGF